MCFHVDDPKLTQLIIGGLAMMVRIFVNTGNTSAAVHYGWAAITYLERAGPTHETWTTKALVDGMKLKEMSRMRHPDPQVVMKVEFKYPSMQIRGSWLKLDIKNSNHVVMARHSFGSFIWQGRISY